MSFLAVNEDLQAIEKKLGRPLRVLHIGNIANNAYYNGLIQRCHGVHADVICYDYYHVMSCPEWEDADFDGEVDPSAPNWWATDLKGWKRPDWFAQGPAAGCINYQHARALGLHRLSKLLWTYLEARSLGHVRYMAKVAGRPLGLLPLRFAVAVAIIEELGLDRVWEPAAASGDVIGVALPVETLLPRPRNQGSFWHDLLRPVARVVFNTLRGVKRKILKLGAIIMTVPYRTDAKKIQAWSDEDALAERDRYFDKALHFLRAQSTGLPQAEKDRLDAYAQEHPRRFFRALADYDIIQGYAIDGFIPFMNGVERFIAYEHGTLRELPFENSFLGALTRAAFLPAPIVFVTNSDVMPSVERMRLAEDRVVCLPHPFHEEKIDRFLAENGHLRPLNGPAVFFSPTRHHWIDTSGSWSKGNDIFLRAAGRLASEGKSFHLVLVEWGKEVDASKALIDELGIADRVTWVGTMRKEELWTAYCRAHAVVDQFTLPALGAVGVEVMALGRRLITAIDIRQLAEFFGEAPPALSAKTVDECAARMRSVIADIEDAAGCGAAVRRWIKERHSAERIMALQARAYRSLIMAEPGEAVFS